MPFAFTKEKGGISQKASFSVFLHYGGHQVWWGSPSPMRPFREAFPTLGAPVLHQHLARETRRCRAVELCS